MPEFWQLRLSRASKVLFKSDKGTSYLLTGWLNTLPHSSVQVIKRLYFISCCFCQRQVLEFYREQLQQRVEAGLQQWQSEQQQEQHKQGACCSGF